MKKMLNGVKGKAKNMMRGRRERIGAVDIFRGSDISLLVQIRSWLEVSRGHSSRQIAFLPKPEKSLPSWLFVRVRNLFCCFYHRLVVLRQSLCLKGKAFLVSVLRPDYSSTKPRLLQYYGQITPVLHRSTLSVPPLSSVYRRCLPLIEGFESLTLVVEGLRLS